MPNLLLTAISSKIIGGVDADIKDIPYQVSMQYRGAHVCGGSIISLDRVLTAAHCTAPCVNFDFICNNYNNIFLDLKMSQLTYQSELEVVIITAVVLSYK